MALEQPAKVHQQHNGFTQAYSKACFVNNSKQSVTIIRIELHSEFAMDIRQKLPLEQQFELQGFEKQVQSLSQEDARALLTQFDKSARFLFGAAQTSPVRQFYANNWPKYS